MLKNPKVKGILVNIFGGIMRCDTIATGVVTAASEVNLSVPLVVAHEGHQRRPRQEDPRRFGSADHLRRHHGGSGGEAPRSSPRSSKERFECPS